MTETDGSKKIFDFKLIIWSFFFVTWGEKKTETQASKATGGLFEPSYGIFSGCKNSSFNKTTEFVLS